MMGRLTGIGRELRENYDREKARIKGEARSQARMVKAAKDIEGIAESLTSGPAKPIQGAGVRMKDGKPMVFHTDGSLRHAHGRAIGKAARKLLKKARQEQRRREIHVRDVEIKRASDAS